MFYLFVPLLANNQLWCGSMLKSLIWMAVAFAIQTWPEMPNDAFRSEPNDMPKYSIDTLGLAPSNLVAENIVISKVKRWRSIEKHFNLCKMRYLENSHKKMILWTMLNEIKIFDCFKETVEKQNIILREIK